MQADRVRQGTAVSRLLALVIEAITAVVAVALVVFLVRRVRPGEPIARSSAYHAPVSEPVAAVPSQPMAPPGVPGPPVPPREVLAPREAEREALAPPEPSRRVPPPPQPPEPGSPGRGRGTIGDLLERARLEDEGAA